MEATTIRRSASRIAFDCPIESATCIKCTICTLVVKSATSSSPRTIAVTAPRSGSMSSGSAQR